jgi:hypothetical protein
MSVCLCQISGFSHVVTPRSNLLKRCDRNQLYRQVQMRGVRGFSRSQCDQGCNEYGQTTPSWKALALLECERTHTVMVEQYTGCQHSTPIVLNGKPWAAICFAIHFWRHFGSLLQDFQHQHSFLAQENNCHQTASVKHFWLTWWLCLHPLLWLF